MATKKIDLTVYPGEVLVDEKFTMRVTGLGAFRKVTILAVVTENRMTFAGCGCYIVDPEGCVDVSNQASVSGTYTGIDQMGLIWSMRQTPGQRKGLRLNKKDVTSPQVIKLSVYGEHRTFEELHDLTQVTVLPLATGQVLRRYMGRGVRRIPVEVGRLRGMLFIPPGPGPFRGVLDMFGSAGGLIEYRASLLATRGFVVLALAFFNYKDLPEMLDELDLDYFKEGAQYLHDHPVVQSGGIGVISVSKGAEIAQLLALHCPLVKAVVSINGIPCVSIVPIKHGQELIPVLNDVDMGAMYETDEGLVSKDAYGELRDGMFELWKTDVKLLSICSADDHNVPPQLQQLQYDRYPEDKKENIELVVYHGAGHLVEPPYSPCCRASYHKLMGMVLVWGGDPKDHAYAQEDAWIKTINFFRTHLQSSSKKGHYTSRL